MRECVQNFLAVFVYSTFTVYRENFVNRVISKTNSFKIFKGNQRIQVVETVTKRVLNLQFILVIKINDSKLEK